LFTTRQLASKSGQLNINCGKETSELKNAKIGTHTMHIDAIEKVS